MLRRYRVIVRGTFEEVVEVVADSQEKALLAGLRGEGSLISRERKATDYEATLVSDLKQQEGIGAHLEREA